MNNLQTAKSILNKEGNTCVLCKGDIIYISKDKGIAPMVNFISKGVDLHEFSAADIIIGKAAAMLFILAGVKEVYAKVMSRKAIEIFSQYSIGYTYDTLTEKIINRKGNDICPMEKTVKDISDPQLAYDAIKQTLKLLTENRGDKIS